MPGGLTDSAGGVVGGSAAGGSGSEDASPTSHDDSLQETRPGGGEGPRDDRTRA